MGNTQTRQDEEVKFFCTKNRAPSKRQFRRAMRLERSIFGDDPKYDLNTYLQNPERWQIYFAKSEDKGDIGYALLDFEDLESCKVIYLDSLGVIKEEQGHGYGKKLMTKVLQHTKDQYGTRAKIIYLKADNTKLVEFYEKLGFSVITSQHDPTLPSALRRLLNVRQRLLENNDKTPVMYAVLL